MGNRTKLTRLVKTLSEADVHTALRFIQFLDQGHIRPRLGATHELMTRPTTDPRAAADGVVQPRVEILKGPPAFLDGAVSVPRAQWLVTLDGFSYLYYDLNCHLWVQKDDGDTYTLARKVPLGQVYFDDKGSEANAVQVALNRSGSVYSDFRFMHRIGEPEAIYLREAEEGELADLIVASAGQHTILEVSIPTIAAPGVRRLAFTDLIKERQAASVPEGQPHA